MNELLIILRKHDYDYYVLGEPTITDTEYDLLREQFAREFPEHPYVRQIGHKVSKYQEIDLPFVMGGLNKVDISSVKSWIHKMEISQFIASEKLDGNSIMVTWEQGIPIFAASRGDAYTGANILAKAVHFLPRLPIGNRITLRGEVIIENEDHEVFGYKNRRNAVTGLLRRDDINPEDLKFLKVRFYEVVEAQGIKDLDTEIDRYDFMKHFCMVNTPRITSFMYHPDIADLLAKELLKFKSSAPYDIDGLVLTKNHSLREDTELPDLKVKFKVNEDATKTTVKSIEWSVTRTGLVRPVVLVEPVEILGVTVSRVTGFNWEYIHTNGIGEGAEIGVVRSGDVIPYITEVFSEGKVYRPLLCPACGAKLVRYKQVDLACPSSSCGGKYRYQIAYFFQTLGADNITDRTVEQLRVNSIQDMYTLDLMRIMTKEGFGETKAKTILKEIQKTLRTKPEKLLQALGIPMIGEETAKSICNKYSMADIFYRHPIPLNGVIGQVAADSFHNNIQKFFPLYAFLNQIGLVLEEKTEGSLTGKIFVLTGNGPLKRKIYMDMCEQKGGRVKSSVNKDTSYLVTNDLKSNSTKMQSAKKHGIKVISYEVFGQMLKGE
jgi:DNA ligase (NAD+)